jgi:DNA-binding MarR family transcriptional regulator
MKGPIAGMLRSLRLGRIGKGDPFFRQHFLNQFFLNSKTALLSKESFEKLFSTKQIMGLEYFQTVDEAAPSELAKNLKIARSMVNQVLSRLLQF